jgi:hypothetical protein
MLDCDSPTNKYATDTTPESTAAAPMAMPPTKA